MSHIPYIPVWDVRGCPERGWEDQRAWGPLEATEALLIQIQVLLKLVIPLLGVCPAGILACELNNEFEKHLEEAKKYPNVPYGHGVTGRAYGILQAAVGNGRLSMPLPSAAREQNWGLV